MFLEIVTIINPLVVQITYLDLAQILAIVAVQDLLILLQIEVHQVALALVVLLEDHLQVLQKEEDRS